MINVSMNRLGSQWRNSPLGGAKRARAQLAELPKKGVDERSIADRYLSLRIDLR